MNYRCMKYSLSTQWINEFDSNLKQKKKKYLSFISLTDKHESGKQQEK